MKLRSFKPVIAMFVFVLLTAGAVADAAANPSCSRCVLQYTVCVLLGGTEEECQVRYEDCLIRYGCPAP